MGFLVGCGLVYIHITPVMLDVTYLMISSYKSIDDDLPIQPIIIYSTRYSAVVGSISWVYDLNK